jgi:DNA-binding response OmpR family regulator
MLQTSARARIAVIDDDPIFLELMQDLLGAAEGYEVFTSASCIGGYEFVKDVRPDLVILDLMLGRQQAGWAVLDLLRADTTTRETPVILCSAAAAALQTGAPGACSSLALETVAKPFDVEDLLATIQRLLSGAARVAR